MSTEQKEQPSKAGYIRTVKSITKAAKTITKIDLVKDKPFSWEEYAAKYGNSPIDEVPLLESHRCEHEDDKSVCITIPNLFVRELPIEYEIRLKYKDEEVRLSGKPGSVLCNNINKVNQPVLKLAIDALAYTEELGPAYQPRKGEAA